jgi:hypothetical protein
MKASAKRVGSDGPSQCGRGRRRKIQGGAGLTKASEATIDQITCAVLSRLAGVLAGVADACSGKPPAPLGMVRHKSQIGALPNLPFMAADIAYMDLCTMNMHLGKLGTVIRHPRTARAVLFVIAALLIDDSDSLSRLPLAYLRNVVKWLDVKYPGASKASLIRQLKRMDLSALMDESPEDNSSEREIKVGMMVEFAYNRDVLDGQVVRVDADKATCSVRWWGGDWELPLDGLLDANWESVTREGGGGPSHFYVKSSRIDPNTGKIVTFRSDGKKCPKMPVSDILPQRG